MTSVERIGEMTYDRRVHQLALWWVTTALEHPVDIHKELADKLAQEIQRTIEDFMESHRPKNGGGTCPGCNGYNGNHTDDCSWRPKECICSEYDGNGKSTCGGRCPVHGTQLPRQEGK